MVSLVSPPREEGIKGRSLENKVYYDPLLLLSLTCSARLKVTLSITEWVTRGEKLN
jgi:hypothetical protein